MNVAAQMPKYRCHKEVHALKIKEIRQGDYNYATDERKWIITPDEDGYAPFQVSEAYIAKHGPQPGGYYVVYADGYQSYSPAEPFENGYTRI